MPPSGAYVVTADEVGNSATRNSRQGRVGRLLGDLLGTLALGRWIYLMYSLNRTLLPQLRVS